MGAGLTAGRPKSCIKERVSFNLARLRKGGKNFEVVVDADLAIDFKNGKEINIRDIIKSEQIFFDAKKGVFASETNLNECFNSKDALKVAGIILKDGEIQLTQEHRDKLREAKLRRIIDIIHRNAVDPKTKLPHPVVRIENALAQIKMRVDEIKPAEEQVEDVIKKLQPILPIRIERVVLKIQVPHNFAHQSFGLIKRYGSLLQTVWGSDGGLIVKLELPAGLQEELLDKLNNSTHGSVEINLVEEKK